MTISCCNVERDVEEVSGLTENKQRTGSGGGLRKQILRRGTSWQTPYPGDQVEVRFSGWIEGGACIDASEEGSSFKFKLGQGNVIKGWEEGVATMKEGERAIFTVPATLAYGEAGLPPLIPPNSTLIFDIEMIRWTTIRDLTGDGGVLKKIIMEGEGWATPRYADEVLVKYEARLEDGTIVSKSDDGLEFQIGHDLIPGTDYSCPAVSIATRTMRKGEKAELAVKFPYGFRWGENGSNSIDVGTSAEANFVILLELLSWKSVVDITGEKKVLKKIIKSGVGFEHPNEGSVAKVAYIGKFQDGRIFERKGSTEEPFEYAALEEQINEDLDRAIIRMKKGEKALVTIRSNSIEDPDNSMATSSSNSVIHYEVELIDFTKEKPIWKMDTYEKLEACERKKNDGNLLFKAGKFWCASKKYEKAEKYLEFDHCFTHEEKFLAKALRLSCYLNDAACKLRLGEYSNASKLCTKALELDPCNIKALYRRSRAYLQCSDLDKAKIDIEKALVLQPANRDVKLAYKELRDRQKEYAIYQAEISRIMLSRMV